MYIGEIDKSFIINRLQNFTLRGFHSEFQQYVGQNSSRDIQGAIMRSFNLKKIAAVSALGLVAILGTSEFANAQNRDDRRDDRQDQSNERRAQKDREKADRERARVEAERVRLEQRRQSEWNNRNTRMNSDRRYQNNNGNYNPNNNGSRYRVYRNGSYYNTDRNGAEMLRQAVNEGYRQGFQAGRNDRNNNRRGTWSNSSVYRSGSVGYQSSVNRAQYQYYFQQGFQRGYQDGSNSRYQNDYNGDYDYGTNNNGSMSILGTILNQILNIQTY